MVKKSAEQLAKEHAEWFTGVFQELMTKVFYEAFLHGYKHGRRDESSHIAESAENSGTPQNAKATAKSALKK